MIYFEHKLGDQSDIGKHKLVMSRCQINQKGKKANSVTNWLSPTFLFHFEIIRLIFQVCRFISKQSCLRQSYKKDVRRHEKGCRGNKCSFLLNLWFFAFLTNAVSGTPKRKYTTKCTLKWCMSPLIYSTAVVDKSCRFGAEGISIIRWSKI